MKLALRIVLLFAAVVVVFITSIVLLTPWMDRWGATEQEISSVFPGDELVPAPKSNVNRAVTINAHPEQIYPWLLQIGADKGGLYSYTWLEGMINCAQTNADRIHPEWQDLEIGDEVKMCMSETAPPPYIVAQIIPNQSLVIGHQDSGEWVDLWQFILVPQSDEATRLILRTRTMMAGGFWSIIHPGVFVMERGMLMGIKERAEKMQVSMLTTSSSIHQKYY